MLQEKFLFLESKLSFFGREFLASSELTSFHREGRNEDGFGSVQGSAKDSGVTVVRMNMHNYPRRGL